MCCIRAACAQLTKRSFSPGDLIRLQLQFHKLAANHACMSSLLGLMLQAKPSKTMSYTNYFADALTAEAKADSRIMAIHAAMAGGTGLTRYASVHFYQT